MERNNGRTTSRSGRSKKGADGKSGEGAGKSEWVSTVIIMVIIVASTFGGFYLLKLGLHTDMPIVVVTSGSMEPTIYRGDLLFVKGVDPSEITPGSHENRTGDIIIYWAQGVWLPQDSNSDPIVHRVIDKKYDNATHKYYFKAQGDNNPFPDNPNTVNGDWIPQDNIIGIVVGKVKYVGYVKIWLSESGLGIVIMVILAFLLIISIAYDLTHPEEEENEEEGRIKGKGKGTPNKMAKVGTGELNKAQKKGRLQGKGGGGWASSENIEGGGLSPSRESEGDTGEKNKGDNEEDYFSNSI
ncbi:MAG: signal peptidase I [Promethearchaeota archaeon]